MEGWITIWARLKRLFPRAVGGQAADTSEATALDPKLPQLLRRFRRAAHRLHNGLAAAGGVGPSTVSISHSVDSGTAASFDPPQSFPILAALLRPFIARSSDLNVNRIRQALDQADLLAPDQRAELANAFAEAQDLEIDVELNGRQVTADDICFAYGDGHLFGEDVEAKALLDELLVGPMQVLVPFMFHSACLNYLRLVDVMAAVVVGVEKAHPSWAESRRGKGPCIYCLTADGTFRTEEHVIPEAFGQDEMVLVGSVCDSCNNELSALDNYLVEGFEPLAFLRTVYVDLTKKGKFPKARFRDGDFEKTASRGLRLNQKTGKSSLVVEQLGEGPIKMQMNLTGKRPFDPLELARPLYKIGLGLVAYDAGPDAARDPRYNAARDFVNGKRPGLPGDLWMRTRAEPDGVLRTQWCTKPTRRS